MIDLRLSAMGGNDSYGFKRMFLHLRNDGKPVDGKGVYSGSPASQRKPFIHPSKDWAGSGNPIPEGVYSLGMPARGNWGEGIGNGWIGAEILKAFDVNNRSAFGIHDDQNRSYSRGSAGCIVTHSVADFDYIAKWFAAEAKPTQLVVDYGLGFLKAAGYRDPAASTSNPETPIIGKYKVMLERGHGPYPGGWEPGAVAHGLHEYDLNGIAVEEARKVLVKAGVTVSINDSGSALHNVGRMAKGFDAFVSVHHNAFNGSAQGSEVLVQKGQANSADKNLAAAILNEVVSSLGFANRGVKEQNLGVLRGAEATDVDACCLTEGYFMDAIKTGHPEASVKYGIAIGKGILKWLNVPVN